MTLQTTLGLEFPIIQAPMAGAGASALAIAACSGGGLGSLPCAMLTLESMREELAAVAAQARGAYNVNFFCHTPPKPDAEREAAWRRTLAPYYEEYDIDPASIPSGPGRMPFSDEAADILEPYKPRVVSFHFGLPSEALVRRVKSWGSIVVSSATTVDEARWLEAHGCDAIIAQGLEAGGHRGIFLSDDLTTQVGTMALLPQVVKAVNVPVIAAGGIADAQGVSAALSLGAWAVQVGTSYLLCPEALTGKVHRAALTSESARHTALTNLFTGRPARGIVNRIVRELGPINKGAPEFPLATGAITPLRSRAEAKGVADFTPLWCGQNPSGCSTRPAAEVTRALAGVRS